MTRQFPDPLAPASLVLLAILTLALGLAAVASAGKGRLQGLWGTYVFEAAPAETPPIRLLDAAITRDIVRARSSLIPEGPFSVEWVGYVTLTRPGSYRFGLAAAGEAELYVSGQLVTTSPHQADLGPRERLSLKAGSYPIVIRYRSQERPPAIELLWADEKGLLVPVPRELLAPVPASPARVRVVRAARAMLAAIAVLWQMALAWLVFYHPVRMLRALVRNSRGARLWTPALVVVLVASAALDIVGIWWGLPSHRGWAPDEIIPENTLRAIRERFSGGWHEVYPPLHFAVLAAAGAPFLLAARALAMQVDSLAVTSLLFFAARAVSVVMAVGTVWVVYLCGRRLGGEIAGVTSAAIVALMPPMVFYGKLANVDVPCVFWFAVSLWFYLRTIESFRRNDCHLFAVAASLAVCTKDQAYAFYVLPFLLLTGVVLVRGCLLHRSSDPAQLDARSLLVSLLLAAGVFIVCQNLVLNFSGFVAHLNLVVGPASVNYRAWPASLTGQAAMAREAARQIRWILGWPALIVCLAGLVDLARRWSFGRAAAIILPALSYYLCFIAVVGYHYDRFFLGPCLVLALSGGRLVATVWEAGFRRRLTGLAIGLAAGAYLLLRAASIDALMMQDSRYTIERWLQQEVAAGSTIAGAGPLEALPRHERVAWMPMQPHPDELARLRPDYVVVNAEYFQRFGPGRPERELYDGLVAGSSGYRLAVRYKASVRWAPLAREAAMRGSGEDPRTNLDKVNPQMEVFVAVKKP